MGHVFPTIARSSFLMAGMVLATTLGRMAPLEADDIFADTRPRMILDEGAGEGPAWDPEIGLLFSGQGNIMRLTDDQRSAVHRKDAGTNGLLFDHQGDLLACEPQYRQVTRTDRQGRRTVLASRYEGKPFNQPNDITVDSRGRIYFSDPCYGDRDLIEQKDANGREIEGVYRIDRDGTVSRIITHEVDRPNGLLVTPDDRFLFVADNNNNNVNGARKLWRFALNRDGSVDMTSQHLIHDWGTSRGPDGMALDQTGRLFVAGGLNEPNPPYETTDQKGGVYVFSPEGKLLDFLSIPRDEVTNCAFGGSDLQTLFITAGGSLWSIRTSAAGRLAWPRRPAPRE